MESYCNFRPEEKPVSIVIEPLAPNDRVPSLKDIIIRKVVEAPNRYRFFLDNMETTLPLDLIQEVQKKVNDEKETEEAVEKIRSIMYGSQ